MPTLKDVAKAAGVHVSTVSLVLNDSLTNTRVSESTRERIRKHARRLGYRRNHLAHALKTQRTGTVGFVGGDVRNPFFAELVAALREEFAKREKPLMLDVLAAPEGGGDELENYFRKRLFDGLLVWSEALPPTDWPILENLSEPVLPFGLEIPGRTGLWLDLKSGYTELAQHLAKLKPQRVLFFAPRKPVEKDPKPNRLELFRKVAQAAGLPEIEPRLYDGEDWDISLSLKATTTELADVTDKDAVVCFNDAACLGAILGGVQNRAQILVGFDGSRLIASPQLPVSFIDLQIGEFARRAVDELLKILEEKRAPKEGDAAATVTGETSKKYPPHQTHFRVKPAV